MLEKDYSTNISSNKNTHQNIKSIICFNIFKSLYKNDNSVDEDIDTAYWNILFLTTNIIQNLWNVFNLFTYKKYKKRWKKRFIWRWKQRKKRKKFKLSKIRIKNHKYTLLPNSINQVRPINSTTNILNYSTITLRSITGTYLQLFYKDNKNYYNTKYLIKFFKRNFFKKVLGFRDIFFNFKEEVTKLYLRNYDRKPYWKLRKSRILHWNFFYNKTLRKRRYKAFLPKFLKKSKYNSFIVTQILSVYCNLHFSFIDFFRISNIAKAIFLNTNMVIYMLPKFLKKKKAWLKKKKKAWKLWKKAKKWSYLRFKRSMYPWLNSKRNFPKFLKQKITKKHVISFSKNHYDTFSHTFGFLNSYQSFYHSQYFMLENKVFLLKLHMFRYKS